MARELAGFNPYGCRVAKFLGRHLYPVADAVTEAQFTMQIVPGQEEAIEDWGRIRKAFS
jgi:hypothetical protein